jgi:hypothetical protein
MREIWRMGYSEAVNRRKTDNAMAKRKLKKETQRSTKDYTEK